MKATSITPKPSGKRKTQAERQEETQRKILECATQIFGAQGYENTSLEDIAKKAGMTITPVYHYFGSKLALFEVVTEVMEQQLAERLDQLTSKNTIDIMKEGWNAFIELCKTPGFAQIVLIDSLHFLGRERWQDTVVVKKVFEIFEGRTFGLPIELASTQDRELILRILIASLAEVALMVGRNPEYDSNKLINAMVGLFASLT